MSDADSTRWPWILKLLEDSGGPIDVEHWYDGDLGRHFTYALRAKFAENPPDISFPIKWAFGGRCSDGRGGKAPDDPVMLYVSLPLGGDESNGNEVTFSCSLEGVVDELIGSADCEIFARVAARLRELANKLDEACNSRVK
jgi:hypothetical protein